MEIKKINEWVNESNDLQDANSLLGELKFGYDSNKSYLRQQLKDLKKLSKSKTLDKDTLDKINMHISRIPQVIKEL